MSEIKHKHKDIEITYDEKENRWRFQLRGRERSAESLAKAKEFIDKPVVEKEEKTFTPIEAWYRHYGQGFKLVTVTSIAEKGYSSQEQYWIKDGKERRKISSYELFQKNAHNNELIGTWESLDSQIDKLSAQKSRVEEKLKPL